MKQSIVTDRAPKAIGPYSQGIMSGNLVITSGQLPLDPATGAMPDGVQAQTKQSLENVKAILESQGLSMADVIKTTVFIKNMDDFSAMNEVYASFFEENFPARSAIEAARLPKDALVEIEVIAIRSY